ncbi:MAG: hypothetical protein LBT36_05020 [Oscillospiraceae bacterium]|jgi:hypothetical protein|nr:hypothetical protein [Oscillospiraceae bacterium]
MQDALVDLLQWTFEMWNDGLYEIWLLLSQSPSTFRGGGIWNVATAVSGAMQGIAHGLLVLFFMAALSKSAMNIRDFKRPETLFRLLLQIVVAKYIITLSTQIITGIFNIGGAIIDGIMTAAGSHALSMEVPPEVIEAIENTSFLNSIALMVVTLVGVLAILAALLLIKLKIYGRFFRIAIYTSLAPIPLAGFAGDSTAFMGKAFVKGVAGIAIEGGIIMLACGIWAVLARTLDPEIISSGATSTAIVFAYLAEVLFGVLLLVTSVMGSEKLVHHVLGL